MTGFGSNAATKCFSAKLIPGDSKFLFRLVIAKIVSVAPVTTPW